MNEAFNKRQILTAIDDAGREAILTRKARQAGGEVSRRTSISRNYPEQLGIHMKNKGLLKTVCGRNGGYLLGRPAESITVKQIIEAAIGPINIIEPGFERESFGTDNNYFCRELFESVNSMIKETLGSFTLADLAEMRGGKVEHKKLALA